MCSSSSMERQIIHIFHDSQNSLPKTVYFAGETEVATQQNERIYRHQRPIRDSRSPRY